MYKQLEDGHRSEIKEEGDPLSGVEATDETRSLTHIPGVAGVDTAVITQSIIGEQGYAVVGENACENENG